MVTNNINIVHAEMGGSLLVALQQLNKLVVEHEYVESTQRLTR